MTSELRCYGRWALPPLCLPAAGVEVSRRDDGEDSFRYCTLAILLLDLAAHTAAQEAQLLGFAIGGDSQLGITAWLMSGMDGWLLARDPLNWACRRANCWLEVGYAAFVSRQAVARLLGCKAPGRIRIVAKAPERCKSTRRRSGWPEGKASVM